MDWTLLNLEPNNEAAPVPMRELRRTIEAHVCRAYVSGNVLEKIGRDEVEYMAEAFLHRRLPAGEEIKRGLPETTAGGGEP